MSEFVSKVSPSLLVHVGDGKKVRFSDGKAEATGPAAEALRKVAGVEEVKPAPKRSEKSEK